MKRYKFEYTRKGDCYIMQGNSIQCWEPGTIVPLDTITIKEEKTMNRKEFDQFIQNFVTEQSALMKAKGKDYSGDEDVVANFKKIASNAGLSPLEVWYVYASKHWDSITSFVKNGKTESEAIRGRFIDMSNYLLLGMAIIETAEDDKKEILEERNAI